MATTARFLCQLDLAPLVSSGTLAAVLRDHAARCVACTLRFGALERLSAHLAGPVTPYPTPAPVAFPLTPAPVALSLTPAPVALPLALVPVALPLTPAPVVFPLTPAPVAFPLTPAPVALQPSARSRRAERRIVAAVALALAGALVALGSSRGLDWSALRSPAAALLGSVAAHRGTLPHRAVRPAAEDAARDLASKGSPSPLPLAPP